MGGPQKGQLSSAEARTAFQKWQGYLLQERVLEKDKTLVCRQGGACNGYLLLCRQSLVLAAKVKLGV